MAKPRNMQSLFNFRESRFTSVSHELRVYIYGSDVTPWLKGDLSVTYGNRDSFNTATFDLSNPRKIWQLTRENLLPDDDSGKERAIWRRSVGEYSEIPKLRIFRFKNDESINPYFNLDVATQTLGNKGDSVTRSYADIQGAGKIAPNHAPSAKERRWRLAINDCIFSRNDPIRIFLRNPYDADADEWVEIFCGFVTDHPITTNYTTGESSVRISCTCIRAQLLNMRVQMNPRQITVDQQPLFDEGFFADFRDPSNSGHPFAKTSLEDTIKELILGTSTPKVGETAQKSGGHGKGGGIGDFRLGNTICYNPETPGDILERWHLMTIFGVNKSPFPKGINDDLWLTKKEMQSIGDTTLYYPDVYAQGPQGRYLHFLLPHGGTGASSLIQASFDNSGPKGIEWTNRWEIIREFAKNLDFQVLTSPSGDILVEFPMYGFTPHILSQSAHRRGYSPDLALDQQIEGENNEMADQISAGETPKGIGSILTFELHQMEDTLNDEAEDFPTILQVDGGMSVTGMAPTGNEDLNRFAAYVWSTALVARYGVIAEQMTIPYAGQKIGDMGDGAESVMAKRLPKLACIEYMKRLAESSVWDGSVAYRPFLFPNRPIWLKRSHRMGNATSVTNRWSIGKSAGTSFSLNMLMSERYSSDTKRYEYRLPTGAANTPISYAELWGVDNIGTQMSGVLTKVIVTPEDPKKVPTSGAAGSVGSGNTPVSNEPVPALNDHRMYPPFAAVMQEAIQQARGVLPAISVTSSYRSPAKQEDMKNRQLAGDPRYQKFAVGEPWRSTHQYGLAIDINIAGDNYLDYKKFNEIANEVASRHNAKIYWGDAFKRNGVGDYIHFEWDGPNMRRRFGVFADDLRQRSNVTDASGVDHLRVVWKYLDGATQSMASVGGGYFGPLAPPPEGTEEKRAAVIESATTSGGDRQERSGAADVEAPSECKPSLLEQSGMNAIVKAGS